MYALKQGLDSGRPLRLFNSDYLFECCLSMNEAVQFGLCVTIESQDKFLLL